MNFNLNDFLQYANTGTAPTVYSRQKAARKVAVSHTTGTTTITIKANPELIQAARQAKPPIAPPEPQKATLELVMYSDRSFAIFGDTKPVKDQLTGLFGKFNPYLKKDGIATPGYIFSIGRLDAVKKSFNL